jgi:hypothetical protein
LASEEILEKKSEGFAPLSARVDVSRLKKDIFLLRKTLAVCAAEQKEDSPLSHKDSFHALEI